MILTSLVKYYEAMQEKGLISPVGYGQAKVSYGLSLRPDGTLHAVIDHRVQTMAGKKQVMLAQVMEVPEPVVRSVGIMPNFLCDGSSYLLGYDTKGKPERTRACFDAAKALHQSVLEGVDSPMARAIVAFFDTWSPEGTEGNEILAPYLEDFSKGANLLFMLGVQNSQEDPAIRAAWQRYTQEKEGSAPMVCLVSGERAPIAVLHPKIKGVRDAQSVGAALVSFNARAFESYGREDAQGLNAPVSEFAAFAYTTALNALLADPKHRTVLGDATVVYWSEDGNEAASEMMGQAAGWETFRKPGKESDKVLSEIFTGLAQGKPLSGDIDLDCPFCILGLAPNAARLSVRFFLRDTFGTFLRRMERHYQDMEITRAPFEDEYVLIPDMLDALANPNANVRKPPNIEAGALVRDILGGYKYPTTLLTTTLMRVRSDSDDAARRIKKIGRIRAAIIKAYLRRNIGSEQIKEECTVALNRDNDNPAYVLGRLFSVLEKAQEDANPGINATIKDRYFNAACANPSAVFHTLQKLSTHHLRKLDTGFRISLEKQITELMGKLPDEPYPKRLTPEEQGLFILGYYHQTQDRYTKKEDK